jgi:uncharacterized membrane protein
MADPVGLAVIAAMAAATYACRALGYAVMGFVPLTTRVRRGLEGLPGAVVAAVVLPGAIAAGPAGIAGVGAAVLAMLVVRRDVAALAAGCGVAALARAAGL